MSPIEFYCENYNFRTKGFSNLNRFVTTLTSTINFWFRFVTILTSTINFMSMDFDYLNYVTSTKLKKVYDKNIKPVREGFKKKKKSAEFSALFKTHPPNSQSAEKK